MCVCRACRYALQLPPGVLVDYIVVTSSIGLSFIQMGIVAKWISTVVAPESQLQVVTRKVAAKTAGVILARGLALLRIILDAARAFAVAVDGATATGKLKLFAVRCRVFILGRMREYHLATLPVSDESAVGLFEILKNLLDTVCAYWRRKLIGYASDGASVMRSTDNGVAGYVVRACTSQGGVVMVVWCGAHEANLGTKAGVNACTIVGGGDATKCRLVGEMADRAARDEIVLSDNDMDDQEDTEEQELEEEDLLAERAAAVDPVDDEVAHESEGESEEDTEVFAAAAAGDEPPSDDQRESDGGEYSPQPGARRRGNAGNRTTTTTTAQPRRRRSQRRKKKKPKVMTTVSRVLKVLERGSATQQDVCVGV
eukprot:GHVU01038360.1.p1 GENE.GHVU01038360.1~~GHVU01038360.1.p1  ORF type:complete len:370 (-),score=55.01 GHVU01038360.1:215-1324(-)